LRLVCHGTLVQRYGYDTLIEALPLIPDAELAIIGDGDQRESLERLAAELGVGDRVEFIGFVPLNQIAGRLAEADLGVVPNRSDVFTDLVVPTKLMEYVALGIPAVVSRTPAVEAYFDSRSVAFFEPGDPEHLARTVRECKADPEHCRQMALNARERYAVTMSWPIMKRRYLDLVRQLVGDSTVRAH
jgi:glycosyltransferase involved in cell wall biosynthesis